MILMLAVEAAVQAGHAVGGAVGIDILQIVTKGCNGRALGAKAHRAGVGCHAGTQAGRLQGDLGLAPIASYLGDGAAGRDDLTASGADVITGITLLQAGGSLDVFLLGDRVGTLSGLFGTLVFFVGGLLVLVSAGVLTGFDLGGATGRQDHGKDHQHCKQQGKKSFFHLFLLLLLDWKLLHANYSTSLPIITICKTLYFAVSIC